MKKCSAIQQYLGQKGELFKVPIDKRNQEIEISIRRQTMGIFNSYPGNKERKLISRMINSVFYFLKFVFILKEGSHYRLVAIEDSNKIIDMKYNTLKGAKIACIKRLRNRFNNKMKPVWSFLYPADEKWIEDKLNCITSTGEQPQPINSRWAPAPAHLALRSNQD